MTSKWKSPSYIEFPIDGPIAESKPFILSQIKKYCTKWKVPTNALGAEGLWLAHQALETWDPNKGAFRTHLFHKLKRLHRVAAKWRVAMYGPKYRQRPKPTKRHLAITKFGIEGGIEGWRIRWADHRPQLAKLLESDTLRHIERAIISWMIEPRGRTLAETARECGISPSRASRIRYRMLLLSHASDVKSV